MDGNQFENQNEIPVQPQMDQPQMNQPQMSQPQKEVHIYHQAAPQSSGEGYGVTSMILGIITLVLTLISCCLPFIFIITAITGLLSLIFGFIGLGKKRAKGQAITGIICTVLSILVLVIYIILIGSLGAGMTLPILQEYQNLMESTDYYYDY